MPHTDRKRIKPALTCTFDQVYECLLNSPDKKVTNLLTSRGNLFVAVAAESSVVGKFIQLPYNNRIYPCCWGNQTNHMGKEGQRIGQYSTPIDQWCKGTIAKR